MELRHLRYYIAVAEELHFGRAAERIGIEQSPLSRAIRELEEDIGVSLLTRTPRGTRMTAAGEILLANARRIVHDVGQARLQARAVAMGVANRLRVGVSPSITQPRLARLLARSRSEEPDTEFVLEDPPTLMLAKALRDGSLDIGLSPLPQSDGIISEALWAAAMAVVLSPAHPLAPQREVALRQLSQEHHIVCHPEICTAYRASAEIHDLCSRSSAKCSPVSSVPMLLEIVAAGGAIGVALAAQVDAIRRVDVVARPLEAAAPPIRTFALVRAGPISDAASRFIQRAQTIP